MTRTARYFGMYVLGVGVALMQPSPWRGLGHYLRKRQVKRCGAEAYKILCQQSTQDATMRRIAEAQADQAAREALKPKPSRLILPPDAGQIWKGRPR